jgi:hypothetical protein
MQPNALALAHKVLGELAAHAEQYLKLVFAGAPRVGTRPQCCRSQLHPPDSITLAVEADLAWARERTMIPQTGCPGGTSLIDPAPTAIRTTSPGLGHCPGWNPHLLLSVVRSFPKG